MSESKPSRRALLVRESLLFQVKLIADGFRDFLLVPISLVATLVGLLRSADDPDTEFQRVLDLGRQSEQWINLFGQHDPLPDAGAAGSLDSLVTRAEAVLREHKREGNISDSASSAMENVLERLHRTVRELGDKGAKQAAGE